MSLSLAPSRICNPLMRMEIRFDGLQKAGGLRSINGARFGMVRDGGKRPHQGVDLYANVGTAIFAIASGEIVRIVHQDHDYGSAILLRFRPEPRIALMLKRSGGLPFDGVLYAFYAHLSSIGVGPGPVQCAQPIGATGTSGNADQRYPHLHFEVRKIERPGLGLSNRLDPEIIFSGIDYSKPVDALDKLGRTA